MEYRNIEKKVNGKTFTIEVNERNKPNIELMAKGIMEATKRH